MRTLERHPQIYSQRSEHFKQEDLLLQTQQMQKKIDFEEDFLIRAEFEKFLIYDDKAGCSYPTGDWEEGIYGYQ